MLSKIDDQKGKHLTQLGLLALSVHTAAFSHVGMFQWLTAPDDTGLNLAAATLYFAL